MSAANVGATKGIEAWYEYAANFKEVIATGHRAVFDPDDERWDGEMEKKPFQGTPNGRLRVAEVTRVDGEVVKVKDQMVKVCHKNHAREFLRRFKEQNGQTRSTLLKDEAEKAEKARKEGREEDLVKLLELAKAVFKPVNGGGAV